MYLWKWYTCKTYCFDDIIKFEHFDFGTTLLDEKLYENTLVYDISPFQTKRCLVQSRCMLGSDANRYLVLIDSNMIEITTGLDILNITFVIYHDHSELKIDSYDALSLEKTLTLYNVVILNSQFLLKTKITVIVIYSWKKCSYK